MIKLIIDNGLLLKRIAAREEIGAVMVVDGFWKDLLQREVVCNLIMDQFVP